MGISARRALSAMGHPNYSESFARRVLEIADAERCTARRAIDIARWEMAELQREANNVR